MSDSLRPPWAAAHQASLSLAISQSLPKFMSIASMMSSSHLILWCPVLLPSIFPSIRVFSNESAVYIRWPKYWSLASASVLLMSIQGWFPLRLNGLISLLFKGLSRVIAFLPRRSHLLISWLGSPSAVTLEPKKRTLSPLPPFPVLCAMKLRDWMPWS